MRSSQNKQTPGGRMAAKRKMAKAYKTTPAVKETYRGVEYKSKTEARWARMFDMLGWPHVYEAMMLGGWNPDFQLTSDRGGFIWVEIKPVFDMFEAVRANMEQCKVRHESDVLAFCYREIILDRSPAHIGRVAVWDAMDDVAPGWKWWDAAAWLCAPIGRWGIAIPDLGRELLLDPDLVRKHGGIAI